MIVRRSINKDELKELPKTVFPGRIHVIQSEAETEKAVAYLQSQPILGIDSETRPSFTKGQSHKVALLQISSDECCFLFRLNMTGLTQPLVDLLENPAVIKVGLSLKDDFMMLHKRAPFTQQSLHRTARLCTPVRHTGQKSAKDLCNPVQRKDFQITTAVQLGSGRTERRTETICRYRCLGLPQHLQPVAGTETNRQLRGRKPPCRRRG